MKIKLFSLAMAALIMVTACSKQLAPEPLPSFQEELSSFLSTKASEPLEETIWKHVTGETFDRYILFKDGEIRLFYGTIDDGELHRYSTFYSAPYTLDDYSVTTDLTYPIWESNECTERITIIKSGQQFDIHTENETYTYAGKYTVTLEERWMSFIATPVPWKQGE